MEAMEAMAQLEAIDLGFSQHEENHRKTIGKPWENGGLIRGVTIVQ